MRMPPPSGATLPPLFMLKTTMGIIDSRQSVIAVKSITDRLRFITSIPLMEEKRSAVGSFSGSAVKTPSTLVPFRITSAAISAARSDAAVSVVK